MRHYEWSRLITVDVIKKKLQHNLYASQYLLIRAFVSIFKISMDFSKHSQGTTSVKVHYAPGGSSNFSLAWGQPQKPVNKPKQEQAQKVVQQEISQKPTQAQQQQKASGNQSAAGKTSVKVHNPPGGKSSITFG